MKKLKVLFITLLVGVIFGCGDGKERRNDTVVDADSANDVNRTEEMNTSNDHQLTQDRNETYDFESAESKQQRESMYSSLNMTQDQIEKYESTYKGNYNIWSSDNPNRKMTDQEWREHRDRVMKDILDKDQYEKYQKWADENPNLRH